LQLSVTARCVDGWMNGWMNGWMYAGMDVYHPSEFTSDLLLQSSIT